MKRPNARELRRRFAGHYLILKRVRRGGFTTAPKDAALPRAGDGTAGFYNTVGLQ